VTPRPANNYVCQNSVWVMTGSTTSGGAPGGGDAPLPAGSTGSEMPCVGLPPSEGAECRNGAWAEDGPTSIPVPEPVLPLPDVEPPPALPEPPAPSPRAVPPVPDAAPSPAVPATNTGLP
jgi:hypothetical protein